MRKEQLPAAPAPAAQADIRASDKDRDRIADVLREALAEGRLTTEEHSERIDLVYRAKTVGELEPLVRDLPAAGRPQRDPAPESGATAMPPHSATTTAAENLIAVFGGASRRGRWRVGRRTTAFAAFGGVEIDLTEAVFQQQEVVINATAVFGGIEIRVPENVSLRGTGTGIFGGFDVKTYEAPDPDAPVVVVTGYALFGGVEAKPKKGKRLRDLRDRVRKEMEG
ncbi:MULTISPECIES: DUF1707 domain-containing protein [Streptomyces]|uniref:DUF1707 domain-containing protein n=1 Tax=Streptomyces lycii TaxID=2654337 RepID=A0ABQ7FNU9_9ACTN|nr:MULTISPECIES: DUF1707 domain-containing protein [Streptomyces]KAF4410069.1 DUF1707 domain-containing protein [Streptomyces lycii]PGH48461.1 hypothetical protein CRI70_23045 [Streptomyces sp. Ru87]